MVGQTVGLRSLWLADGSGGGGGGGGVRWRRTCRTVEKDVWVKGAV